MVATVTEDGLVKAIGEGKVTITVESISGNKTVSCEITVNKRNTSTYIKTDDISKEAKEFALYDIDKINKEYNDTFNESNGNLKKEYLNEKNQVNDLWREKNRKYDKKRKNL